MSLSELQPGQSATIGKIDADDLRIQLLRFGIASGTRVTCHTRLPLGPVVVRFQGQEIAVGHTLARQIEINA